MKISWLKRETREKRKESVKGRKLKTMTRFAHDKESDKNVKQL